MHTIASSTRICGPFTAIRVLLFGNVNDREWSANGRKYALGGNGLSAYVLSVRRCQTDVRQNRICRCSRLRGAPRTHTIASSTRICGPFTAIHVLLLGNVNDREWSANGRKYPLGGDGLSADDNCLSADVRKM